MIAVRVVRRGGEERRWRSGGGGVGEVGGGGDRVVSSCGVFGRGGSKEQR